MEQSIILMLICEILYHKHKVSLYNKFDWKCARKSIAKGFKAEAAVYIGGLFASLREEVGMRAPTFIDQIDAIEALGKEIEDLSSLSFVELKNMVVNQS